MGKVCTKCKVEKELTEFGKNRIRKDGLQRYCKICKRIADRKYNESEAGKLRTNKFNNSEEGKISKRKYNQTEKGKEVHRKISKNRREKHPQLTHWYNLLRSTLNKMGTTKSKSTIEMLGYSADELFNHLYSLGYKENDHIDHKIPLSWFREGSPAHIVCDLRNLQPLKPEVNISKGNRYADEVDEEYYRVASEYILEEYL